MKPVRLPVFGYPAPVPRFMARVPHAICPDQRCRLLQIPAERERTGAGQAYPARASENRY